MSGIAFFLFCLSIIELVAWFIRINKKMTSVTLQRYKLRCSSIGHTTGYVEQDISGKWWYAYQCRHKPCKGHLQIEVTVAQVDKWRMDGKLEEVGNTTDSK